MANAKWEAFLKTDIAQTFDFSIRLGNLVDGCLEGGNTKPQLIGALQEMIKELEDAD